MVIDRHDKLDDDVDHKDGVDDEVDDPQGVHLGRQPEAHLIRRHCRREEQRGRREQIPILHPLRARVDQAATGRHHALLEGADVVGKLQSLGLRLVILALPLGHVERVDEVVERADVAEVELSLHEKILRDCDWPW